MSTGNYPIRISVTDTGYTGVGAEFERIFADRIDHSEKVYGSQIRHRCAVWTPKGYRIMTPTRARKLGHVVMQPFPGQRH